jgi:glycine/D-amino acid oxidase-like deaminating enzyme/glycine cleavage system aminomethyltransferase T
MGGPPSSARVVVIGGGIGGVCAAYHLANLGMADVLVLERAELSSGTTWHSTGNMETYRADPLIFEMVRYAAELYPRVARESGQDIGWRTVGRVMYTDREERWALMRTLPELGRARGIDIELLSAARVRSRLPIIDEGNLIGGIWVPSDARVNPTDAVTAFARLARARGVQIREHCRVLGIAVREGSVCGVVTGDGEIDCGAVILAAGLWSGDIVESCGLRLPLHALEHQYLITKPCGVDRNMPLFLSYDDQLYGREEVGGIIVGSLDDHAIAVSTARLSHDFSSCLLNERWDQFEPYMATAMRRFPVLRTAPVKMLLNGPECFTPDGQMLLGPIPGATGLYAACGFNSNGMALAPAAGRYIAEWIVEGAPSADVAPLDVRRFSPAQSSESYMCERVTEIPGYHCRMKAPDDDYRTARDIRRSPVHDQLAAAGARFASANAWERALWFDPGSAGSSWLDAVAREAAAGLERILVIDRSSDAKYWLAGPGASDWLATKARPLRVGGESDAMRVPLPGVHGQVEAVVRVLARQHRSCLVTASPDQETRLAEWLRRAKLPPDIRAVDQTAAYACLELHGPRRAALIHALTAAGCEIDAREDFLNASTVLTIPTEFAADIWRRLVALGADLDAKIGGHFAEEALRIARGAPAFGREISPAMLVGEIHGDGPVHGSPAARASPPRTHRARILATFSSPMALLGFGAHDVILDAGRPVGELTSRVRLPGWPTTLALGLLDPACWHGGAVAAVADGKIWPLEPRRTSWQAALIHIVRA